MPDIIQNYGTQRQITVKLWVFSIFNFYYIVLIFGEFLKFIPEF